MTARSGRHFLQIPGPTNVPDRVLRAIDMPTMDHRGPEFAALARDVIKACRPVFKTEGPIIIFPSSGTGAWEAAIVNALCEGDRVLMFEVGQFAVLWQAMAERLGLDVEWVPGDWRRGVDPAEVEARLREDKDRSIRAVMVVHNETSTGVLSPVAEIRAAMDRADHPALLMVDTVSSLGCTDYRHDEWRVDVTVTGSQKGLMMPSGLGFNAVSQKALAASRERGGMARSYWDWEKMLPSNAIGAFPYTPASNLFYGLREALAMLAEEGLDKVFARHQRHAEATRAAVRAWGLDNQCQEPRDVSPIVTAVVMPERHSADRFRGVVLDQYDMSLGSGLGKVQDRVFRIGHLGHFNDLSLVGALSGVEMGLSAAGVPHRRGGVAAAMDVLSGRGEPEAAEAQRAAE